AEAGGLFESVGHLQDAEVCVVAADDLHSNGKTFRGEAAGDGGRWIAGGGDIPTGLHPVDVVGELHACNFGRIRRVYVEWLQLRGGKNEIFVLFEECLKEAPEPAMRGFGAREIRA